MRVHPQFRPSALGLVVALIASSANAQVTLNAAAAANNNGGAGWAIFFDLQATSSNLSVTELTSASTAAAGAAFNVEVFTRTGTALGGPASTGPGSDPTGWTSLGTAAATQGPVANDISLPIDIPDIALPPGQLTGVAVLFSGAGPRYANGTLGTTYHVYSDADLTLTTGDSRSTPFLPSGSWFSVRQLVGSLTYELGVSPPVIYCTAGTSTNGCVPAINVTGTPSAAASSGFTFSLANLEGQKQGLFFYGVSGAVVSGWGGGNSTLCVKTPTQRMSAQFSGGTLSMCDGAFSQDWLAFVAANPGALGAPFSAGNVVNAQGWYRDPPAVKTTNLTDAVEFTVVP